jgi:hypothetical protein
MRPLRSLLEDPADRSRALAAIASVAAVVAQLLAFFTFVRWLGGADGPGDCPPEGGEIGWVQVPDDLEGRPGEIWGPTADAAVLERVPDGDAVCALRAGQRVVVLDPPVDDHGRWVAVVAEAILQDDAAPDAEPAPEPQGDVAVAPNDEPAPSPSGSTPAPKPSPKPDAAKSGGRTGGPCPGERGSVVGYIHLNGPLLVSQGGTWTLLSDREVLSGRPRKENGWRTKFPVVCRLEKATRLTLKYAPIKIADQGLWVPVVAGAMRVP